MIKLFATAFRPAISQQRSFQRQFQYNFTKISKKDQERLDKKQEKQNLGLSKIIDFTLSIKLSSINMPRNFKKLQRNCKQVT
ncbi:unnamed protein product [Paramecium octaurelia]|uniref:Uncharacterized protein n=1 Tax=Paramecium octaurelia TaxID=43137 RepID=A0A8S1TAG4_PAROT|nr:unnamed protein product [Paramecium octaurelia]CAD8148772.1 unnamed protein product [Paramecium octaurelia]